MNSIWFREVSLPRYRQLEEDIKTDVLIIGGGIAGVLCAYFLQQEGIDYVLLEGGTICSGITKNTTAKITSQHGLIYNQFLKKEGALKAALYLKANQDAVMTYRKLCKGIDCDFESKSAYVYSRNNPQKLINEAQALDKLGFRCKIVNAPKLPFETAGAICFDNQAQINPLKFICEIARPLNIYENSFVKEVKDKKAVTQKGSVTFKKIIYATHFPIDNKHGMYFLKLYQHRSYVIALDNADDVEGMYIDESKEGLSFRNYKDYLLIGGGSHRTGKNGGNYSVLRDFAKEYYNESGEVACWATQDCMSLDGIPYIGYYSKKQKNCYVATGFNKWGMTSSMVAAKLLTDLVLEKDNPYSEVFNPLRNMLRTQLYINGFEAIKNMLTLMPKRCPHLGCALKWNATEHTWDCPCHGSRFSKEGKLLDNPANDNLK